MVTSRLQAGTIVGISSIVVEKLMLASPSCCLIKIDEVVYFYGHPVRD